ncbi:MAG: flagellar basal body-associated FliL family protein [Pseudomonadota bacterium]
MAKAENDDDETKAEEGGGKKAPGLLMLVAPAILAGGVAFGISYLDPLGLSSKNDMVKEDMASPMAPPMANEMKAGADGEMSSLPTLVTDDDKKKKSKKKGEEESVALKLLTLEPIIISLADQETPGRRAPRLRVAVAVEGKEKSMKDISVISLKLRDGFTAAARGLPPEILGGPEGLETLRDAFLEEARSLMGEDAITSILITDYLMT